MQKFFVSLVFVVNALTIYGQNKISILEVGNGFQIPVEISNDGVSEDIYVVEKAGRIFRVDKAGVKSLLADIRNRVNSSANERGLLGLAFHPHFEENGYFFVNYTRGDGATVISRFELLEGEQMVNPGSEKIVLTIPQPFNNHNGGSIKFGMDGYLYIGMGDGGSGGDPGNRA